MPFPNRATQFRPGNPGGPGRPRTKRLTDATAELMQHPDKKGRTGTDLAAEAWRDLVAAGDMKALKLYLERTEGKSPLTVQIEAEISHRDADLPAILAALGLGSGTEAASGPEQSGGTGGGQLEGPAHESALIWPCWIGSC